MALEKLPRHLQALGDRIGHTQDCKPTQPTSASYLRDLVPEKGKHKGTQDTKQNAETQRTQRKNQKPQARKAQSSTSSLRPLRLCVSFLGLPQDRMKREKLCRRQLLRTGLLGDSDLIENGGHSLGGKACQLSNPSDQLLPPKPK